MPVKAFGNLIASTTSLMGIAAIAIPPGRLLSGLSESIGQQDKNRNDKNHFPSNTK